MRRLRYMETVFRYPQEAAALLQSDHPHLARRLEKQMFRNRSDLYRCVAALEAALEGRAIANSSDAIRMDLYRYFKRQGLSWPRSTDEWRDQVLDHLEEAIRIKK